MSTYKIGRVDRSHVGDGGLVINRSESLREAVREEFARLVGAVTGSSDSSQRATVAELSEALAAREPDKKGILERIQVMTAAAGATGAVAQAADALAKAVQAWHH
jgi:hypothetical protein